MMVALPAVTAAPSPLPLTVATAMLLLDQVTAWPGSELPFPSVTVAVNWAVWPIVRLAELGFTATAATAAARVVLAATLDRGPKTALGPSAPRNDTSWKL